jgi:hypothetical protein
MPCLLARALELTIDHILAIARREGWRAPLVDNGPLTVVNVWFENRQLIEFATPELLPGYLATFGPANCEHLDGQLRNPPQLPGACRAGVVGKQRHASRAVPVGALAGGEPGTGARRSGRPDHPTFIVGVLSQVPANEPDMPWAKGRFTPPFPKRMDMFPDSLQEHPDQMIAGGADQGELVTVDDEPALGGVVTGSWPRFSPSLSHSSCTQWYGRPHVDAVPLKPPGIARDWLPRPRVRRPGPPTPAR